MSDKSCTNRNECTQSRHMIELIKAVGTSRSYEVKTKCKVKLAEWSSCTMWAAVSIALVQRMSAM